MSEMEKLVDKIRYRLRDSEAGGTAYNILYAMTEDEEQGFIEWAITLIGNAYAQGIVKLPGEVGRVNTSDPEDWSLIKYFREPGVWMTCRYEEGAKIFIALSPSLEDSVKEE